VFDRLAGAKPVRGADPPAPVELTVVASGARAS
jgi:hypothetical protein